MKKTVKRTTRTVEKKKTPMSVKLAKTLINHPLNKVIDDSLKEFGTYVVEERAVPSYQDGLKPSQRRVLWAMYYAKGNRPEKGRIKSADAEGATMAYHPHSGAYPTIVNMIEGTPCPLMIGYGNFGSFSKLLTPAAASRYCFRGGTLIATDNGFKRIEAMYEGDKEKASINDRVLTHKGYKDASTWLYSGKRELYMVRTQYGCVIATDNEPFMVMTEDGRWKWKTLNELHVGEVLIRKFSNYSFGAAKREIDFQQTGQGIHINVQVKNFDEKVAEWLGFVISEGTHSPYEISVGMANKILMKRYLIS